MTKKYVGKMGKEELQNHLKNKRSGHIHLDKTKRIDRKKKYKTIRRSL